MNDLSQNLGKYYDSKFKATAVKILPGDCYVSENEDEMLVTTLGSCISACIRDPKRQIGGMNHFMLPESSTGTWGAASRATRFGNHAMETLINGILSRGGKKERLEIKIFGGGNVISGVTDIGDRNSDWVEEFLRNENLPVVAHNLRGKLPRRVHYFPATGKVMMRMLPRTDSYQIVKEELVFRARLAAAPTEGSVELF